MAIAILLLLFSGLFLGALLVTVVSGFIRVATEETPAVQPVQTKPALKAVEAIPSFFAVRENVATAARGAWSNEELIQRLEGHLRSEQALVARFLLEPSVDSLYRRSPATLHVH